jgi:hypothetical protein
MVKQLMTLAFMLCLSITSLQAQSERGKFTENILHFAEAGDIEHLETLKALPLANDERLALDALTTANGRRAAELYLKLLTDYPTSALAPMCRQRLAEYQSATKNFAHLVLTASAPEAAKPEPVKTDAKLPAPAAAYPVTRYTLQFGSFSTRAAAPLPHERVETESQNESVRD